MQRGNQSSKHARLFGDSARDGIRLDGLQFPWIGTLDSGLNPMNTRMIPLGTRMRTSLEARSVEELGSLTNHTQFMT